LKDDQRFLLGNEGYVLCRAKVRGVSGFVSQKVTQDNSLYETHPLTYPLLVLLFPALTPAKTMKDLAKRDGHFDKKFTDVPFTATTTTGGGARVIL